MLGIARASSSALGARLSGFYVSIFRNIPLLLQMFVWFFVVPELLPARLGLWFKRDLPIPSSGPRCWRLRSIPPAVGGVVSGRAAGRSARAEHGRRCNRHEPGADLALRRHASGLRIILPPLTSEFLSIVKNSSLALTIGVLELTAQSRQIENFTFHGFEAFGAATAFYVLVALVLNLVMVCLQRTLALPVAV